MPELMLVFMGAQLTTAGLFAHSSYLEYAKYRGLTRFGRTSLIIIEALLILQRPRSEHLGSGSAGYIELQGSLVSPLFSLSTPELAWSDQLLGCRAILRF